MTEVLGDSSLGSPLIISEDPEVAFHILDNKDVVCIVDVGSGGGVGIGKAINGGFGMVCDGSDRVDEILRKAMLWDVMGGVARRSWARNENAMSTVKEWNDTKADDGFMITEPFIADEEYIRSLIEK